MKQLELISQADAARAKGVTQAAVYSALRTKILTRMDVAGRMFVVQDEKYRAWLEAPRGGPFDADRGRDAGLRPRTRKGSE